MYGTYDPVQYLSEANQDDVASVDLALEVAAGDTTFTWQIYWPCRVVYFGFLVSVAFDYATQTAEGIVALDKRITFGSDTGRVEIGRVDLEDGLAISAVRFIEVPLTNANCDPGDQLVCEVVTAGTGGGGIAGDWVPFVVVARRDEVVGNLPGMTQSTLTQVV